MHRGFLLADSWWCFTGVLSLVLRVFMGRGVCHLLVYFTVVRVSLVSVVWFAVSCLVYSVCSV